MTVIHKTLSVSLIGFLNAKLRDLRGIRTLINEMLQNADDAPGATEVIINFADDGLHIYNNGVFREEDFERLRNIASGNKRYEDNTTGAFGIGFISVYQVTDSPEVISNSRKWVLKPDMNDVEQSDVGPTTGTQLRLPWATDPFTPLRSALDVEPVSMDNIDGWLVELSNSLLDVILFLRKIRSILLQRNGALILSVSRSDINNCRVKISTNDVAHSWLVLTGSFADEEVVLRREYHQIESKRKNGVSIAIPDHGELVGQFYACLPTHIETGLPLHINADFYTTSDRKGIHISEFDYQSKWNQAAIMCATKVIRDNIIFLRDNLSPERFWNIIDKSYKLANRAQGNNVSVDLVFAQFWKEISSVLSTKEVIMLQNGEWGLANDVRLSRNDEEHEKTSGMLIDAGIKLVHSSLRRYHSLLISKEIGVKVLSIYDLLEILDRHCSRTSCTLQELPLWLASSSLQDFWWLLERQLVNCKLLERNSAAEKLATYSLVPGSDGLFHPGKDVFYTDAETFGIFSKLINVVFVPSKQFVGLFKYITKEFGVNHAMALLAHVPINMLHQHLNESPTLLRWFSGKHLNAEEKKQLSKLSIFPSIRGLYAPLANLALPGENICDPLRISNTVDLVKCEGLTDFLVSLGAKRLDFVTYITDFVIPELSKESTKKPVELRGLVDLLSVEYVKLLDKPGVKKALSELYLIECTDGKYHQAITAYLKTPKVTNLLGEYVWYAIDHERGSTRSLLSWLGVSTWPRPADVKRYINKTIEHPFNEVSKKVIQEILKFLSELESAGKFIEAEWTFLQEIPWLPAVGKESWYKPSEVFSNFRAHLFESQALFLDIPRKIENLCSNILNLLEIKAEPAVPQVVDHLLYCSRQSIPVNPDVYRFLNYNYDHISLDKLKGQACLYFDAKYVRPDYVFWGPHSFGSCRYTLSSDFRKYQNLFSKLGVKEAPDYDDAISVLSEIATENNSVVTEAKMQIIIGCWKMLTVALEENAIEPHEINTKLGFKRVVPNLHGVKLFPSNAYFEDFRFRGIYTELDNELVSRIHGAWPAMSAAGVRKLSDNIEAIIVKKENQEVDCDLPSRIKERSRLFLRCLDSIETVGSDQLNDSITKLKELSFMRTTGLSVKRILSIASSKIERIDSEKAFLSKGKILFYCLDENGKPWNAIAREISLSLSLVEEKDIGLIAPTIRIILESETYAGADGELTILGYPPLDMTNIEISNDNLVTCFGGMDLGNKSISEESSMGGQVPTSETFIPSERQITVHQQAATIDQGTNGATDITSKKPRKNPVALGLKTIANGEGLTEDQFAQNQQVAPSSECSHRNKRRRIPKTTSRYRTFVKHYKHIDGGCLSRQEVERRDAVNKAGINRILKYELSVGRVPTEMDHFNPGFDIKSVDSVTGEIRYIEAKSCADEWDEVGLTKTQYKTALELGTSFWLYVVEKAQQDDYKIFLIQDPAQKVNQYFFDIGWRVVCDQER